MEGDDVLQLVEAQAIQFQSTSLMGSTAIIPSLHEAIVSIHAPNKGVTVFVTSIMMLHSVSIHTST